MDKDKLRYYAARGHFGYAALVDPDAYVTANSQGEESTFHQALRELPGDIMSAFSPSGLSNSLDLAKHAIQNTSITDLFRPTGQ